MYVYSYSRPMQPPAQHDDSPDNDDAITLSVGAVVGVLVGLVVFVCFSYGLMFYCYLNRAEKLARDAAAAYASPQSAVEMTSVPSSTITPQHLPPASAYAEYPMPPAPAYVYPVNGGSEGDYGHLPPPPYAYQYGAPGVMYVMTPPMPQQSGYDASAITQVDNNNKEQYL